MLRAALQVTLVFGLMTTTAHADDEWFRRAFEKKSKAASPATAHQASAARPGARPQKSGLVRVAEPAQPFWFWGDQTRPTEPARALDDRTKPQLLKPMLPPSGGPWAWKVTKAEWTAEDERGFEAFVTAIGESECATVHECLTSAKANPRFYKKNPPGFNFFADCADLPFVLRAYYAWHVGLPFSFSTRLSVHPTVAGGDQRLFGFSIADRHSIVGPGPDLRLALQAISQFVASQHFRVPAAYRGTLQADHYPVKISREGIRPGTVVYDPDGHVTMVYKVTDDGRVLMIDSHPDNSLTRGTFNREFGRSEPAFGAGFKRWRPQKLVGATRMKDGRLIGGRILLARDSELADWSDEQFVGTVPQKGANWKQAKFMIGAQSLDYNDYVRMRLAGPGFKYTPVQEVREMVRQLCRDLKYRVIAVDAAIRAGIDRRPQPDRLPSNIYATTGDWETYATPSRDARLKTAFEELRDEAVRFVKLHEERSTVVVYDGKNLRADLAAAYTSEADACSTVYTASNGEPRTLAFEEARRRLFKMSFDPHHCVERRWGAETPAELKTCGDSATKRDWYLAQDRLRNQITRTYGEQMGWGLGSLQNRKLDIGNDTPPDVDVLGALQSEATAPTPSE